MLQQQTFKTEIERKVRRLPYVFRKLWKDWHFVFKEFANYVLQEKKKEVEETKESIVKAPAKIIKSEIREVEKSNEYYPTNLEVQHLKTCSEWIPESVMILLNHNAKTF